MLSYSLGNNNLIGIQSFPRGGTFMHWIRIVCRVLWLGREDRELQKKSSSSTSLATMEPIPKLLVSKMIVFELIEIGNATSFTLIALITCSRNSVGP
jgi:hypothetical protein